MLPPEIHESRSRLLVGLHKFQTKVYPQKQADYQRLAREGKRPRHQHGAMK
jgi:hypothetical protein